MYTALHEIAQLNIARALYENAILTTLEHSFQGIFKGRKYEVDIMSGTMLYEVKPIYSLTADKKQAENYSKEGNFTLGLELQPILNISLFGSYYMDIYFYEGVALYEVHMKNGDKERVILTNKQLVEAYNNYKLGQNISAAALGLYYFFFGPVEEVIDAIPHMGEY